MRWVGVIALSIGEDELDADLDRLVSGGYLDAIHRGTAAEYFNDRLTQLAYEELPEMLKPWPIKVVLVTERGKEHMADH